MFSSSLKRTQSVVLKGLCAGVVLHSTQKSAHADGNNVALSPKEFKSFKISKITTLSHNTKAFEVALPSKHDQTVNFFDFIDWIFKSHNVYFPK